MGSIRVGVTGLSRAGKSVFVTSAIYNLLATTGKHLHDSERQNMVAVNELPAGVSRNRENPSILRYLGEQLPLDDGVKPFPFDWNVQLYRKDPPEWPKPTHDITEFKLRVTFINGGRVEGPPERTFIDYPGERLLDIALTQKSYSQWSDETLNRLNRADEGLSSAAAEYIQSLPAEGANPVADAELARLGRSYGTLCPAQQAGVAVTPVEPLLASTNAAEMPFAPLPEHIRVRNPALPPNRGVVQGRPG